MAPNLFWRTENSPLGFLKEVVNMGKKNSIVLVLVIVLTVSLLANGILLGIIFDTSEKSIVGTYCTNGGKVPDGKYIVFEPNGDYVIYKQFELIEKGRYTAAENHIYTLKQAESGGEPCNAVFNNSDVIYFSSDNKVETLSKISDVPTYINLQDENL